MVKEIKKTYKILLASSFLVALTINGLKVFLTWYALTPNGSYGLQILSTLLVLPLLLVFLIVPLSFVTLIFKKTKGFALILLCSCLLYIAFSFLGVRVSGNVRSRMFHGLTLKSTPLITAINAYERDTGHPP